MYSNARQCIQSAKRSLLLALVHINVKNKRSQLGILWYLIEPLGIFALLLLIRQSIPTNIPNYPLYLFTGLMLFNFFANGSAHAARALVQNRGTIHWAPIPLITFPTAHVFEFALMHGAEVILLGVLLFFFDVSLFTLILYPFIFIILLLWTLGIGYTLSVLSVFTEDVAHAWRAFATRLLLFGTPIFYSVEEGTLLYSINQWNPLYHIIEITRAVIIYGSPVSLMHVAMLALSSIVIFVAGIALLYRYKQTVSEHI